MLYCIPVTLRELLVLIGTLAKWSLKTVHKWTNNSVHCIDAIDFADLEIRRIVANVFVVVILRLK